MTNNILRLERHSSPAVCHLILEMNIVSTNPVSAMKLYPEQLSKSFNKYCSSNNVNIYIKLSSVDDYLIFHFL